MRIARCVVLGVVVAWIAACAGGDDPDGPTGEAGAGSPAGWSLTAEPELVIGAGETADPAYLFERIAAVRLLGDGRVAVADQGAATVRTFDAQGRLVAEWGGQGEGPGEFDWINHLEVAEPDTLIVQDAGLMRFTTATPEGEILDTRPIATDEGRPEIVLGRYPDGGWAVAWIDQGAIDADPADPDPDPMVIGRFSADGSLLESLATGEGMVRGGGGMGPVPFSPWFHGTLVGDRAVFTDGQVGVLHVVDEDGEVPRTVAFDLPAVAPEAARAALETRLEEEGTLERAENVGEVAWAQPVPRIARMLHGEDGRIWLKHYDPAADSWLAGGMGRGGPGGTWSVVRLDGTVVAEVRSPDGFIPMDVRDGRVAGITVDALGVERVAIHRLRR